MDCLTALQLVSDAMDKLPVDNDELSQAKVHCSECTECGAFVRAMLAVQRSQAPSPPSDLVDRVVAQIRAEASENAYARARSVAAAAPAHVPATPVEIRFPQAPVSGPSNLFERLFEPRNRRSAIAWLSSAAVVFILAAWGAVAGTRAILAPQRVVEYEFTGTETGVPLSATPNQAQEEQRAQDGAGVAGVSPNASGPQFIVVESLVYRLVGSQSKVNKRSLAESGSTRTDLGSQQEKSRTVYRSPTGQVYIEDDERQMLAFEPVQFAYAGAVYHLTSGPLETYDWPTLPEEMGAPEREDGAPTFEPADEKTGGGVFVQRGKSAADGIALPPRTTLVAALSACPTWTWWVTD